LKCANLWFFLNTPCWLWKETIKKGNRELYSRKKMVTYVHNTNKFTINSGVANLSFTLCIKLTPSWLQQLTLSFLKAALLYKQVTIQIYQFSKANTHIHNYLGMGKMPAIINKANGNWWISLIFETLCINSIQHAIYIVKRISRFQFKRQIFIVFRRISTSNSNKFFCIKRKTKFVTNVLISYSNSSFKIHSIHFSLFVLLCLFYYLNNLRKRFWLLLQIDGKRKCNLEKW